MEPKYSVLFCNQDLQENKDQIGEWLKLGIKVFWFGTKEEAYLLRTEYQPFVNALFLQVFEISISDKAVVFDGQYSNTIIQNLEKDRPEFNAAQYQVEHCKAEDSIIVEASAGTGKTTVMIDRIMYLMHIQEDLKLSELFMITFTNDATNQMNMRLQEMLLKKYQLTGNRRYLVWLEEQSQMNISTIDSFAYSLLKEYGIDAGFSNNIGIHTFNYERKEVIKDEIDEILASRKSVSSQMGMSLYKGNSTLDSYWKKFAQLGFTQEGIMAMNWGLGIDETSEKFQQVMIEVFERLDTDYLKLKQRNNAVSLNDILRDLSEILSKAESNLSDLKMKYLFVDEFQDSDNSQIKVLIWLMKHLKCRLFVVGDIKQSIYRFRGATDTAFNTLEEGMQEIGSVIPERYTLVNNYRTSSNVLKGMDVYFRQWGADKILDYKKSVIPFNKEKGILQMLPSAGSYSVEEQFCNVANRALIECGKRIAAKNKKPTEKDRVVVLARTNRQLIELSAVCQKNHIPAIVKREGSFFLCEAVRDFYAMISSYVFSDEPKYLFNYLLTPYAGLEDCIDIAEFEVMKGNREKLFSYMDQALNHTEWKQYDKLFRLEPVMAVVKKMLDSKELLEKYVACKKRIQTDTGWTEEKSNISVFYSSKQYKANLDKLLEILQRNSNGEFTSLYDIYNFLKVSIETNREEQEEEVEDNETFKCLNCMTVHKAKGLEFDTVIIPYTDFPFYYDGGTEILVNNENSKIGWNYRDKNTDTNLQNSYYGAIRAEEDENATEEETRILYVAMTRAINTLICLVAPDKKDNTWAHLIREVGIDNEQ